MSMKTFVTTETGLKGIDLAQWPDSAWTWYANKPETMDDTMWALVAATYRVINMTAEGLASLPFVLMQGETEYDVSDDWQNKLGWLPDPKELLRLWRMSLFMSNSAYGFMERVRGVQNLRYIVGSTVEPVTDDIKGITGFKRRVGQRTVEYPYQQGSQKNIIFPIYHMDHTTELLPSENTEFRALMNACGTLYYTDYFVKDFFKRGGVIPSLIGVKGVPNQLQQDKIERGFDKLIRNIYKYVAQVWNAEMITVTPLGQGVESLQKLTLYENSVANVAMAAGMPLSLLMANSANYATAREEKRTWFENKIVPDALSLATILNRELFEPYGVKLVFRPEETNEGTEEEAKRAQAFQMYTSAGIRPSVAAQIVGIELPDDIEYDDLDTMKEEDDQKKMEQQQEQFEQRAKLQQNNLEKQTPQETNRESKKPPTRALSLDQLKELQVWRDVALRRARKGQDMDFVYEPHYGGLPDDITEQVKAALLQASTDLTDVRACFDVAETVTEAPEYTQDYTNPDYTDAGVKLLADALNNLANATKAQPPNWSVTLPAISVTTPEHNYTFSPEMKAEAPVVNVTLPDQPAPVVNITNQVETPAVNVTNEVKPAPVKVQGSKRAMLVRDNDGRVTGIETE